jgi:hypothetical protein
MMDCKEFGRKRSSPNFKVQSRHSLEGLSKTTKILSQDSRSPCRGLNVGSPEYQAEVLAARPRRSVIVFDLTFLVIFEPIPAATLYKA